MNSPNENYITFLNTELQQIREHGPNRVVIDKHGEALSPQRSREKGVSCDVIFIRADGWSLGTPTKFLRQTRHLWEDEWIGVTYAPFNTVEVFEQ